MLSWNCKNVQDVKIYLPCNFEVNSITYFGVITLFSSIFQHFNTFRPLFQKLIEINVKFKLQTCSACQDLSTMQFWSNSCNPFWSYFPFFIKFYILILFVLYFKNYKIQKLSLNRKNVQLVKIYMPCNFEVNLITRLGVIALF